VSGAAADSNAGPVPAHRPRAIDAKLMELLVCPLTKGPLDLSDDGGWLVSRRARLRYPVRDGIPILLADEAEPVEDVITPAPFRG
jgi:uncharacterized protein YbaR (Trm112 family)